MTTLPVYDRTGAEVGSVEIDPAVLAPRINKQLLHDVVVMYQANRRQGSAKTKSRAEVSASTKKLFRQKGTGNARMGSRCTNVRRGGGHGFAKRPRDFSYRLPRKAIRAATRMAIASKIRDQQLVVIDELSFDSPTTKEMASILSALGLRGISTLVATDGTDVNVYKSARNIPRVTVSAVSDLNALIVLSPRRLLVTRAALDALGKKKSNGEADDVQADDVQAGDVQAGDEA